MSFCVLIAPSWCLKQNWDPATSIPTSESVGGGVDHTSKLLNTRCLMKFLNLSPRTKVVGEGISGMRKVLASLTGREIQVSIS